MGKQHSQNQKQVRALHQHKRLYFFTSRSRGATKVARKETKSWHSDVNYKRFHENPGKQLVVTRTIAFERYTFIYRKQRKNETLEQFHADLVELALWPTVAIERMNVFATVHSLFTVKWKNCRRTVGKK